MDKTEIEEVVMEGVEEVLIKTRRYGHGTSRQVLLEGMTDALIFCLALIAADRVLLRKGISVESVTPEFKRTIERLMARISDAVTLESRR